MQKKCLVISYGPVPTPEFQTIEGGGMRAWGLSKGLVENGIDVTIAINSGFPITINSHDGIKLINWNLDGDFIKTINSFDAVIVSYCMGDVSVFVADNINDNVQLILDAYVPIYIEVSARDAKEMSQEYINYQADVQRHNHALKRGDYFLYANPAQEQLYNGVLSALGIINPFSYRDSRLISTPFGIHRDAITADTNPYNDLGVKKDDFVVLWFGGIYPWFRIEEYLESIKKLSSNKRFKFVFVGGKNPFNDNPDIASQYKKTVDFAKNNGLTGQSVFFIDWVDFDTRINWFHNADVIVSLNQPGEENKYSWRTRVMDFVWGEAAIITNGGDPLSEEMIEGNAAVRLPELSSTALSSTLEKFSKDPAKLKAIRKNVRNLKEKYFWDVVTKNLLSVINNGELPYAKEEKYRKLVGQDNSGAGLATPATTSSKLRKIVSLPAKASRLVKKYGVRKTAKVAVDVLIGQKSRRPNRKSQFVFISHPIDNSGAPVVLLQTIEEYVKKYGASRVRLITPNVTDHQKKYLKSLGIRPEKAVHGTGLRFVRLQLGLQPNDFVLMNTIAVYDNYRDFVLVWLKLGRLKHAYWFIHEDKAQIPVVNPSFLSASNIDHVKSLTESGKLSLMYPSERTKEEYEDILGAKGMAIKLRVDVPKKYCGVREEKDFNSINILLSGTSTDGRKGQVLALSALQHFIDTKYSKNPNNYRDVHLNLLAVSEKDYISQQIRWIAKSALGKYVTIYNIMPKDDAMALADKCNAVLCCSLNETFGLYIAEGMLMGHILLRNNVAGEAEQLINGKNGYLIDHTDIKDIADKIEKLASKTVSSKNLLDMSKKSQEIMSSFQSASYLDQIESLKK